MNAKAVTSIIQTELCLQLLKLVVTALCPGSQRTKRASDQI
jgi:hypothetical protein